MRISSRLVYQIVSFSPAAMRVCKFRKHGQKYRIVSWNTVPCQEGGEPAALRKALEENGGQISGCMILTGAMESGTFFTCPGAPLNVRAQKNALEFELPLHMLQVPQDCVVQFTRFPAEVEYVAKDPKNNQPMIYVTVTNDTEETVFGMRVVSALLNDIGEVLYVRTNSTDLGLLPGCQAVFPMYVDSSIAKYLDENDFCMP